LTGRQLAAIYSFIRRGSRLLTGSTEFWDSRQQRSVALDEVPNAAELVANGHADPFCFWFTGLRIATVELPELGLFVWPDAVTLIYRMGPHWTREAITAFFGLLRELYQFAPQAAIATEPPHVPPDRFLAAWSRLGRAAC
jgi:hypothetical protein